MTTPGGPLSESDPDDGELLNELSALRASTAPPPSLTELAQQAFQFRSLDAEVAALVSGPDDPADPQAGALSVRRAASDRRLVFEPFDGRLSMELTVTPTAGRYRLEGHVLPSGEMTVDLRRGSTPAPVPIDADPWGGFVVDGLEPGPIRVTCRRAGERPVSSEWFLLG